MKYQAVILEAISLCSDLDEASRIESIAERLCEPSRGYDTRFYRVANVANCHKEGMIERLAGRVDCAMRYESFVDRELSSYGL